MKVDMIVGIQWGDEGKGKIVDLNGTKLRCRAVIKVVIMQDIPFG